MMAGATTQHLIWRWPVRVAHWTLATLVIVNLFNDDGSKIHRYIGYAAVAVVVLRLLYGWLGRDGPARPHWPGLLPMRQHFFSMLRGEVTRPAGHNPLGGAMTLMLWTLVLMLGLSGWVSRWDMFWGDDWPHELHESFVIILQVCVLLHLGGVVISSVLERQNLVRAMLTGRKQVDEA